MLPLRFLLALAGFVLTARATTVIAPTFDELVGNSELIFRGHVTSVKSVWRQGGPRPVIATEVTFAVERTLRGNAGDTVTLEFLGGTIGDKELRLAGWPRFQVGERGLFFVEDRTGQVCPLMRLGHGRYRIVSDAASATERVLRDDGTALRDPLEVSLPINEADTRRRAAQVSEALTLTSFESQIIERSAAIVRPSTTR